MLVFLICGLLSLFHKNPPLAVEAGQCAADQLRPLVRSSRGAELMLLMYSDPYEALSGLLGPVRSIEWFTSNHLVSNRWLAAALRGLGRFRERDRSNHRQSRRI